MQASDALEGITEAEKRKIEAHFIGVLDIVGGSVYDALVGQASVANGRTLLTRDRRAERTYRSLQVEYRFVG
jgi:hypothetical protein